MYLHGIWILVKLTKSICLQLSDITFPTEFLSFVSNNFFNIKVCVTFKSHFRRAYPYLCISSSVFARHTHGRIIRVPVFKCLLCISLKWAQIKVRYQKAQKPDQKVQFVTHLLLLLSNEKNIVRDVGFFHGVLRRQRFWNAPLLSSSFSYSFLQFR